MPTAPTARPAGLRALSLVVRLTLALWATLELRGRAVVELLLRPRFTIGGHCQHNGACCHHILMADDPLTTWPVLGVLGRFWLCGVYRFRPTENAVELPDGRLARVYTCDNLTTDCCCREHFLRPLVCRQYPRPRYFEAPALHTGCGYHVVDRRTGERLEAPPSTDAGGQEIEQLLSRWRD